MNPYEIRRARLNELDALPHIELSAARLLTEFAPESVLAEATSLADFESSQRDGLLWVAADGSGPVGFAQVRLLEPLSAHLDELDVHPHHGRRGLGRQLVGAVVDWASAMEMRFVTLSTFRDPPWNAPFYARLGFEPVPEAQRSAAMRRVVVEETRRGLDPTRRLLMRRSV